MTVNVWPFWSPVPAGALMTPVKSTSSTVSAVTTDGVVVPTAPSTLHVTSRGMFAAPGCIDTFWIEQPASSAGNASVRVASRQELYEQLTAIV